jgi:ABC-type xylose transport system permease subunit
MRESVRKGFSLCVPICVGVFAYAGVFGVLAAAKGVPASLVALMGVLVFSGSAQFVIVTCGGALARDCSRAVASMNLRYLTDCARRTVARRETARSRMLRRIWSRTRMGRRHGGAPASRKGEFFGGGIG